MPAPESRPAAPGRRVAFVYYRIQPACIPALLQAFERGMRAADWSARLMRRVDDAHEGAGVQTWMEVYESPPEEPTAGSDNELPAAGDTLQEVIERRARAAGIVELVDGERHYEIFEPCA